MLQWLVYSITLHTLHYTWLPLSWVRFEPMTLGCEAEALTNRPQRRSHSHIINLFYLCQSGSICYLVLPSFRFWRNYIILYSNINVTYCCTFVVTVLLVQWLAWWLHTQDSQVQISLIQWHMNKRFSGYGAIYKANFHILLLCLYLTGLYHLQVLLGKIQWGKRFFFVCFFFTF